MSCRFRFIRRQGLNYKSIKVRKVLGEHETQAGLSGGRQEYMPWKINRERFGGRTNLKAKGN